MLKVGITGNIGSGKTSYAKALGGMYGYPVYFMDDVAKEIVMLPDVRQHVIAILGESAYDDDGSYNRKYVAGVIFNDDRKREQLSLLIGNYIVPHYKAWLEEQEKINPDFVVVENAIFFETNSQAMVDFMVCVTAPKAVRMERAMRRDDATLERIEARESKQMEQSAKAGLSDYVIDNGGDVSLPRQAAVLFRLLKGVARAVKNNVNEQNNK